MDGSAMGPGERKFANGLEMCACSVEENSWLDIGLDESRHFNNLVIPPYFPRRGTCVAHLTMAHLCRSVMKEVIKST
jgi:hypothetical protein